jgi:hypothetical protein
MALCEQSHSLLQKQKLLESSRSYVRTRRAHRVPASALTTAVFLYGIYLRQYVLNQNTRTALSHGGRCRPGGASKHSPGFARNIPWWYFFFSFFRTEDITFIILKNALSIFYFYLFIFVFSR